MTEEERRPLMIHPNPNWGSASRRVVGRSSGEEQQRPGRPADSTDSPSTGIHVNQGRSRSHLSCNTPRDDNALTTSMSGKKNQNNINITKGKGKGMKKEKGFFNRTRRIACGAILLSAILERVAYYGVVGNLVLFLNMKPFRWESYHAMNALLAFFGVSYIASLIGGWLADSVLGRFRTLVLSFAIYVCGMLVTPFLASKSYASPSNLTDTLPAICASSSNWTQPTGGLLAPLEERCAWLVYLTLIVIAIGCGALKANICPFGFDQLAGAPPNVHFSFFNWYYWCINIGSIFALSILVYFEQQNNFQYGYISCTAALGCSWIILLSGQWFYKIGPPDGSVLSNVFHIIQNAWRNKRHRRKEKKLNDKISECSKVDQLAKTHESISFLDHAKHKYGGIYHHSLVEDVKKLKVTLAVFAITIPYWLVYFQMQTTFVVQGLHMKLSSQNPQLVNTTNIIQPTHNSTHHNSFVLAVAWFSLFDAGTVIVLLPLFDRVIYPWLRKLGYRSTFARRITSGMIFALAAMLVAGIVEHFRLKAYWPKPDEPCLARVIHQEIGNTLYNASDMHVYWQIPQYVLLGASEVFASVACLQFAVSVAPKSMKAVVTGLHFLFMGVGSLLGMFLLATFSSSKIWFNSDDYGDINCRLPCKTGHDVNETCHLDYYFYLLAGVDLAALLLFLLIVKVLDLNQVEEQIGANESDTQTQTQTYDPVKHVQSQSQREQGTPPPSL